MNLIMLGIHQRETELTLRERFAFDPATLTAALQDLRRDVSEALLLVTCNRVEVYAVVADEATGFARLAAFLARWHAMPLELVQRIFTPRVGEAVVCHLLRLAAGLDSMVLGEDQIVGQLKEALSVANAAGATGKILKRLVNQALSASKRVRTATGLASHPVSVVSVALDQAQQELGALTDRRCLILGAGHMGELALKVLHSKRVSDITIISRTFEHAQQLALRFGVKARPLTELTAALEASEVVLAAIATPTPIIDADLLYRTASDHPRLLLDLSVPRSVDATRTLSITDRLYDIDTLQAISERNRSARVAEIDRAEALIATETQRFLLWFAQTALTPTIRALRAEAETIRDAEVQRALARLPDLTADERAVVSYLGAAIVNKLLHRPLIAIKDPEHGDEVAQFLNQVFELEKRATS
jgi:glutamyl-tRNA reductase